MRLLNYLNEIFDTDVEVTVQREKSTFHEYVYEIDGIPYIFAATKEKNDIWDIVFYAKIGGKTKVNVTNTGNAPSVFAAAIKSINIFLNKVKPDRFAFTAKEISRQKLYDRISKATDRYMPGYDLVKVGEKKKRKEYSFEKRGLTPKTSLEYTSKGIPVMKFPEYTISLSGKDNKYNWVHIKSSKSKDMVSLDFKGVKRDTMPTKIKNKVKKIFANYDKDGYVDKGDIQHIYNDLKLVI
jgi:hypothetical protein